MRRFVYLISLMLFAAACDDKETSVDRLNAPSDLEVEPISDSEVMFYWKDTNDNEIGYSVFVSDLSEGTDQETVGITNENVTQFKISGLEDGHTYFLGVKADAPDSRKSSSTAEVMYKHEVVVEEESEDESGLSLSIVEAEGYDACIYVKYSVRNLLSLYECGLCWSDSATPTVDDARQASAPVSSLNCDVTHVLSNTFLEYGKTYKLRAYSIAPDKVSYSNEVEVSLGSDIQPIKFDWIKQEYASLPPEIQVYKTTDKLNGGNFTAWYAIADMSSGNVGFKVLDPGVPVSLDEQFASDESLFLLVNGGYFHYTGTEMIHAGYVISDGKVKASNVYTFPGSIDATDPQNKENYRITRGMFGVDGNQKPEVYWVGRNMDMSARYYDNPLPSVVGENKYLSLSDDVPSKRVLWAPKDALSAGPVLLKDGKCPFGFTETDKGYYMANFELIAYDVYESTSSDRTAVGYTEDGKIVIFVCDGRMDSATGASLTELAQIMKGLGCVGAVNMDGGGSTGLVIDGGFVNYQGHGVRDVMSAFGFYKR